MFAANGCLDKLVLVASSFHRSDTKTKSIEARQSMQTNGVHTNARFAADKAKSSLAQYASLSSPSSSI